MWPRTRFHFQLSSLFFLTWVQIRMGLNMLFLLAVFGSLNFEETRNGDGKGRDGRHVKLIDNGNGGIDMQKGKIILQEIILLFDVIKPPCHCT